MGEPVGTHPDPLHAGVDLQMHWEIARPGIHQRVHGFGVVEGRCQSRGDDAPR